MGRHGVPKRLPIPSSAVYSCISTFLSSGPRSLRNMVGIVPLRKTQTANMRRASSLLHFGAFSSNIPWQTVQMYVIL